MRNPLPNWLFPALELQKGTAHSILRNPYDSVPVPLVDHILKQKHHIILHIGREILLVFSIALYLYQPFINFHGDGR